MKQVQHKTTNERILQLVCNGFTEQTYEAAPGFWIPFLSTQTSEDFRLESFAVSHSEFKVITVSCKATHFTVKLGLVKVLIKLNSFDAINLLSTLWANCKADRRKECLTQTAELIYYLKNVLDRAVDAVDLCADLFACEHSQVLARIDLIREVLLQSIIKPDLSRHLPKWKGKSMQFIELISIGIELNLFEGQNQNEICNSLLKAFQVDAESDQPIYKQRFNALFKRSKVQLPLIANYINKIEETKKMKVILTLEE